MNHVQICGRILGEPRFHTNNKTDVHVGVVTLCCGQDAEVATVSAIRNAAAELSQFQNGDQVFVVGRLVWREGKIEIFADNIHQWTNSVYQRHRQEDKFPRQVKGMRGVPLP
jgi:hypothetical protein